MSTDEYKCPEVTFKYYLPENQDDVWIHTNASKMYCLLHELDQHCRKVVKYEESPSEDRVKLAEEIRDMIHAEIDMDMVR